MGKYIRNIHKVVFMIHKGVLFPCMDVVIVFLSNIPITFREFMKTEEVTKPPDVENIRNKLLSDQKVLNNDRIKLIKTLR